MKGFVAEQSASLKILKQQTDKIQSCQEALMQMDKSGDLAKFTTCGLSIGTVLIFRQLMVRRTHTHTLSLALHRNHLSNHLMVVL